MLPVRDPESLGEPDIPDDCERPLDPDIPEDPERLPLASSELLPSP